MLLWKVKGHLLFFFCPCHNSFFYFNLHSLLFTLCQYWMALFNCMFNKTKLKIVWKEIFAYTSIYLDVLKNTTEVLSLSSWPAEWHSLLQPYKYKTGITIFQVCHLVSSAGFIMLNFISGPLKISEVIFWSSFLCSMGTVVWRWNVTLFRLYHVNTSCFLNQSPFQLPFLQIHSYLTRLYY
jgi:hypothetical protein